MTLLRTIRTGNLARVALGLVSLAVITIGHATQASARPKDHTIVIEAMKFSPQTAEVNAGDNVVWLNKDPFPHTVVANSRIFHSHEIPASGSWKWKATKKGSFAYVCTLRPRMKGTLVVK